MRPQFISLVIRFLWEISLAETGRETSTDNTGTCAAGWIIAYFNLAANQKSFTSVCCNVALVFKYGGQIVKCTEYHDICLVNPVKNFNQTKYFALVARGYSCIYIHFSTMDYLFNKYILIWYSFRSSEILCWEHSYTPCI